MLSPLQLIYLVSGSFIIYLNVSKSRQNVFILSLFYNGIMFDFERLVNYLNETYSQKLELHKSDEIKWVHAPVFLPRLRKREASLQEYYEITRLKKPTTLHGLANLPADDDELVARIYRETGNYTPVSETVWPSSDHEGPEKNHYDYFMIHLMKPIFQDGKEVVPEFTTKIVAEGNWPPYRITRKDNIRLIGRWGWKKTNLGRILPATQFLDLERGQIKEMTYL